MAHFAELDKNNNVLRVIVIHNQDCQDESGSESEATGQFYCKLLFGENSRWVQTSYNKNFRGKYAGIGDMYDDSIDEFVTPVSPGIMGKFIKIEE
jgi:hypothetical protein